MQSFGRPTPLVSVLQPGSGWAFCRPLRAKMLTIWLGLAAVNRLTADAAFNFNDSYTSRATALQPFIRIYSHFFLSFFNAALRHSVYRAGHRYQAGEKSCGRRNSRENGASQWTMSSGGHLGGNSRNGNEHRWQDSTSVRSTAWEVFS